MSLAKELRAEFREILGTEGIGLPMNAETLKTAILQFFISPNRTAAEKTELYLFMARQVDEARARVQAKKNAAADAAPKPPTAAPAGPSPSGRRHPKTTKKPAPAAPAGEPQEED